MIRGMVWYGMVAPQGLQLLPLQHLHQALGEAGGRDEETGPGGEGGEGHHHGEGQGQRDQDLPGEPQQEGREVQPWERESQS